MKIEQKDLSTLIKLIFLGKKTSLKPKIGLLEIFDVVKLQLGRILRGFLTVHEIWIYKNTSNTNLEVNLSADRVMAEVSLRF